MLSFVFRLLTEETANYTKIPMRIHRKRSTIWNPEGTEFWFSLFDLQEYGATVKNEINLSGIARFSVPGVWLVGGGDDGGFFGVGKRQAFSRARVVVDQIFKIY
ncbi:MAG: hypothetical protein U5J96_16845 [Ignavibacteriaceae bacterium]|nr:hypothetical protein [Ignavibacteriaceae bacterium]